jgi:mRNA-degrading endonuclease RelE of RelBE toxin-antitoxin system
MYKILVSRKVLRSISRMPESIQMKLANLLEDLRDNGAIQTGWPNFSRIRKNEYHCHLSRKWVACWYWEKGTIEIEVYYAGSRENAPY